jgi:DNA-binding HxlR family transcriptional regulator
MSFLVYCLPSVAAELFRLTKEKTPEDTIENSTLQDLDRRFFELSEQIESWSEETAKVVRSLASPRSRTLGPSDLDLVKTVLGKWSIHIIAILYTQERVGFAELRKRLKGISSRVLSQKLKEMEDHGLIRRTVLLGRPPQVRYELRSKGRMLAKLGRPVMLFIMKERHAQDQLSTESQRYPVE